MQTGCATTDRYEWRGQAIADQGEQPPASVCTWPDIDEVRLAGVAGGFLDDGALGELEHCRKRCDTTRDLAAANADALDACIGIVAGTNAAGERTIALAESDVRALEKELRWAKLKALGASAVAVLALLAGL